MKNIEYRIAEESWKIDNGFGNHRFIVSAPAAEYVRVILPWRRRDLHPEKLGIRVCYGRREGGVAENEIKDVVIEKSDREEGRVVFRAPVSGEYELYYMPFGKLEPWHCPKMHYYLATEMKPEENWKHGIDGVSCVDGEVIAYESRTAFDSFWPMETIQTADEKQSFFSTANPFRLVAESRLLSVRMKYELPLIWRDREDLNVLADTVADNEHYAFQTVVCATEKLENIHIGFTDGEGNELPDEAITCFNLTGTDTYGKRMTIIRNTEAGEVLPLWCGVRCELLGDKTEIVATVSADNTDYTESIKVTLSKNGETLPRNGDDDMWRMGRLFWLNSTIGISEDVIEPYTPVEVDEVKREVSVLGRRITVGKLGLPASVLSYYNNFCELDGVTAPIEILNAPMELIIESENEKKDIVTDSESWSHPGTIRYCLDNSSTAGELKIDSHVDYEADGHIDVMMNITALEEGDYSFRLHMPVNRSAAPYMMGMCHEGGETPMQWEYDWNVKHFGNYAWFGGYRSGIQIKIMQDDEVWGNVVPLPKLWYNDGKGLLRVKRDDVNNIVNYDATTGTAHLCKGDTRVLHFHIIVTPLHPVDYKSHWTEHYYHKNSWHSTEPIPSLENAKKMGTSIVILHQGGPLNENINYPFHLAHKLKEEIDKAHGMGLRYKIYYTIRELSTCATELWALLSLDDEIYQRNNDGFKVADYFLEDSEKVTDASTGGPWLIEHLIEGYSPAWHQFLESGEYDCAIRTQSKSRWHNYYLQGLDWLMRVVGIDGIYLDGIGYDRHTTRRVRRVMKGVKDRCDIDIHCGNDHCCEMYGYGNPACDYLEHFAYADNIWNGEGYDYPCQPANYYFTEVSGLPFGLTGEMLEQGGHPWRGMLYGMTTRCGWSQGGISRPIFDVWDDFEISRSKMYGYWNPDCPVNCESDFVKATAYVRDDGEILIAIASWYNSYRKTILSVNKEMLGIDYEYELYAPKIEGMQEENIFAEDELITLSANEGWILRLRRKN